MSYKVITSSYSSESESSNLRAIFAQINAEVRKTGRILDADEGSFYVSKRFSWKGTVKEFFDAYHKICERKQVRPIYQESKLSSALKVPFADIDTINLLYSGAFKRLSQFGEARIPPFNTVSANPSIEELRKTARGSDDADIKRFLESIILIDEELHEYVRQLDVLAAAYNERVAIFSMTLRGVGDERSLAKKFEEANNTIESILAPYISKLKRAGTIASSWKYSFNNLPLTDDAATYLSAARNPDVNKYWTANTLPLKSARDRAARKAAKLAGKERKKATPKDGKMALSTPSRWYRFDRWVTRAGERIEYKIDDISNWIMAAWVWIAAAMIVAGVIIVWVEEGFFVAALTVIILIALIGILAAIMETLIGLMCLIVKYVSYIPLYLLRVIFYRGWTLLLTILAGLGYLTYLFLKARYII